jgi:hypothetical protein
MLASTLATLLWVLSTMSFIIATEAGSLLGFLQRRDGIVNKVSTVPRHHHYSSANRRRVSSLVRRS